MQERVAVIDIGSNTIKLLVAEANDSSGGVSVVYRNTRETRIGKGISAEKPTLTSEAIRLASDTVEALAEEATRFSPKAIRVVATSAARDASNGADLARAIREKAGLELEILSGNREGELIGTAIQLDPAVTAPDFYVVDLGGGSLECLRFAGGRLDSVASLPLGCVRLSEKLLADPAAVFSPEDQARVGAEVETVIQKSGFQFSLPPGTIIIGTGGTLTTALGILAAQRGLELDQMPSSLSRNELRDLLNLTGQLPLSDRLQVPRLSAGRADVFPTALATFMKIVDLANQDHIFHSFLNLRYGLASEMLRDCGRSLRS